MMALLDGELPESERTCVESHLQTCPQCQADYERFEQLSFLTTLSPPSPPSDFDWQYYYRGVCRKLETRASWTSWSFASLLLVSTGTLLFFTSPDCPLALTLGVLAMVCGGSLMGVSYFCNCGSVREKR